MTSHDPSQKQRDQKLPYVSSSGEVTAMVSWSRTQKDGSPAPIHPMMPRIAKYLQVIETIGTSTNITRTRLEDKAIPKHRRPSLKRKGGNAPVDYTVAELLADLRTAYAAGDVREAIILFALCSRHLPL